MNYVFLYVHLPTPLTHVISARRSSVIPPAYQKSPPISPRCPNRILCPSWSSPAAWFTSALA